MFTTTERNTERWLPPINSGVSAVDSQRDLTYDLVEIDLPADITLPAEMINSQE